ncbi:MAG: efflux RND transporter periplasmic adaptor subunit [Phaeodactylibacter sp.]|uniref:efflux RND transporter periplasmic adaptor subunit n=1 Tax=Phaeodactylibacter sp. TaxID=1940289 RepID=UPI0032EC9D93
MNTKLIFLCLLAAVFTVSCEHQPHKQHEIGTLEVTTPMKKDTIYYKNYVSQIHAYQHIELRALEKGYLQKILVDEGQFVTKGQLLFQIQPTIYQAELRKAQAEVARSAIEYQNTKTLADSNIVSQTELALASANLEKVRADSALMQAHLNFTEVRAPFSGIVGQFEDVRLGSLLDEGELLTTLSDNSQMWVYFNVQEAVYLDYMKQVRSSEPTPLKLKLANNELFGYEGTVTAIESDFNNATGTIPFRATFKNPNKLLRHGQTGNILWPVELNDVVIIPQKATFEVLDKKFVFVVDEQGQVHSREIEIGAELNHVYVVRSGLSLQDQILIEGLRKVQNGDHIEFEKKAPSAVFAELELHAE